MAVDLQEALAARHSPLGLASVDLATGEGAALHVPDHLAQINRAVTSLCLDELGDKRGIILAVPPRHGKSTLASVYTPAWYAATWPQKHVVVASAELSLATTFVRSAREVLQRNADVMRVELDPDMKGSQAWRLRRQGSGDAYSGSVRAVGVSGALTGRGASLLIVDDAIKNMSEAHSRVKRESLEHWFDSVAATRLEPRGKMIVIGTRWAEGDLIGHLLETEPERWEFLSWAAVGEDGEPLWSERFSAQQLERIREQSGNYVWEALYQSRPPADFREGAGSFAVNEIEVLEEPPDGISRVVATLDFAATEDDGDYSAVAVVGVCQRRNALGKYERHFVVLHVARAQLDEPFSWAGEVIKTHAPRNVPVFVERRSRSADGKIPLNFTRRALAGHTVNVRGWKPGLGKEWRAIPAIAACGAGRVAVVRGDWNRAFLDELAAFPHGKNDDQADAFAVAVRELDKEAGVVDW